MYIFVLVYKVLLFTVVFPFLLFHINFNGEACHCNALHSVIGKKHGNYLKMAEKSECIYFYGKYWNPNGCRNSQKMESQHYYNNNFCKMWIAKSKEIRMKTDMIM